MIRYQLRCAKEHEFEAWFRDSAAFDDQSKARKILCPTCSSAKVSKAIMAPAIGKRAVTEAQPAATTSTPSPIPTPAQIRAYLKAMRAQIEATHENVGRRFPEEARKIHYGEAKERAIYGEATAKDARELLEEGVEIVTVPWLPHEDA